MKEDRYGKISKYHLHVVGATGFRDDKVCLKSKVPPKVMESQISQCQFCNSWDFSVFAVPHIEVLAILQPFYTSAGSFSPELSQLTPLSGLTPSYFTIRY